MYETTLAPLTCENSLTCYLPLPRGALEMGLSSTALILYALLLDRGTLSQKNRFADEAGKVYVIYPIEELSRKLGIRHNAVGKNLKQLEENGLIRRARPAGNAASFIFLNLPRDSLMDGPDVKKDTAGHEKNHCAAPKKVGTSNRNKQHKESNRIYQPGEESL